VVDLEIDLTGEDQAVHGRALDVAQTQTALHLTVTGVTLTRMVLALMADEIPQVPMSPVNELPI